MNKTRNMFVSLWRKKECQPKTNNNMIAEFRIKNYLSIKTEQCLSFEATPESSNESQYCVEVKEGVKLLKTAIIYGANASGKTNVLNALSFFQDIIVNAPKDKNEKIKFECFRLDNTSRYEKSEMSLTFYLDKVICFVGGIRQLHHLCRIVGLLPRSSTCKAIYTYLQRAKQCNGH